MFSLYRPFCMVYDGIKAEGTGPMNREEIFSQLYSSPEVYRPPLEENSALLEVTSGCSYGRCFFCDFRKDAFRIFSMEHIFQKIELLSMVIDGNPCLHFLGCNPFCLRAGQLLAILERVHLRLPCVETVSMYARADDVLRKSAEELLALRLAGVGSLHVGIESGSDAALALHNKGETAEDLRAALRALDAAGIRYHLCVIPGLGGKALSEEHARKTAALLSAFTPLSIWCIALKIWPGTPLAQMEAEGSFEPLSPLAILREERDMIERLNLHLPCLYVDSSVLLRYTVAATLPENKEGLLRQIDTLIAAEEAQG